MKLEKLSTVLLIGMLVITAVTFSKTLQYENNMHESNKETRIEMDRLKLRISNLEVPSKTVSIPKEMRKETFFVTAYCRCVKCCGKNDGITASGVTAKEGMTIAADPTIKFGTLVYIEGVGYREVQDRGGAIKGNHIDLYFDNHEDALEFGKKNLLVEFIR